MLKSPNTFLLVMLLCLNFSFADDLSNFNKYFSLVKDKSGNVEYVRMKFSKSKLSLNPFIEQVKNDLKKEIERMRTKSGENEIEYLLATMEKDSEKTLEADESILALRKSFDNLKGVDVDNFFDDVKTKGVLLYFKDELEKALMLFDLSVLASTQDPSYFYKRNITYSVVEKAINFAKKRFDSIPLLNLVSYLMVEIHELVLEQRLFHQNMLLHYLENTDEIKIGLKRSEADKIFSSIYESRIGVLNYNESKLAKRTWSRYGLNKFYASVRSANNKYRRSTGVYDEVGKRLNFSFFMAVENGQRVIKNLFHRKHKFSTQMTTAYNLDRPDQIRRFRALLNIGKIGLGFLTLPSWLKGQVESFVDSYYVEQKRLEGALVAYFDINGNKLMSQKIREQLINPYILDK